MSEIHSIHSFEEVSISLHEAVKRRLASDSVPFSHGFDRGGILELTRDEILRCYGEPFLVGSALRIDQGGKREAHVVEEQADTLCPHSVIWAGDGFRIKRGREIVLDTIRGTHEASGVPTGMQADEIVRALWRIHEAVQYGRREGLLARAVRRFHVPFVGPITKTSF